MKDKMYTLVENQPYGDHNYPITIEFFDNVGSEGNYEIRKLVGDSLALSIFRAEKINTIYFRKELNNKMKAFIESEDLKEIPSNGKAKAI